MCASRALLSWGLSVLTWHPLDQIMIPKVEDWVHGAQSPCAFYPPDAASVYKICFTGRTLHLQFCSERSIMQHIFFVWPLVSEPYFSSVSGHVPGYSNSIPDMTTINILIY